jgi:hypothetical protein
MKLAVAPQQLPLIHPRPSVPRPAIPRPEPRQSPRSIVAPTRPATPDVAPAMREPFDSSVRFVEDAPAKRAASPVLDALNEKLLNFTMDLVCLETAVAEAATGTPEARWLERRGVALSLTRDALAATLAAADHPSVAPLCANDAPLAAYLQGLFLYTDAVTSALVRFASEVAGGGGAWGPLRERVSQATHWYFDGLPREVRSEALDSGVPADALDTIDDLFFAACFLAEGLEERAG